MRTATAEIVNKLGLHARAAARLVGLVSSFNSRVELRFCGQCVNGKSIMGVMMLAASCGSQLEIMVDGADEEQAINDIVELIADGFGE